MEYVQKYPRDECDHFQEPEDIIEYILLEYKNKVFYWGDNKQGVEENINLCKIKVKQEYPKDSHVMFDIIRV